MNTQLRDLHDKLSDLLEDPARDLYAETIFTLAADYLAANAASLADPPACHAPTGEDETEDEEIEARLNAIRELANDQHAVDGKIEIDDNSAVSEGDDNGAYVSAWVWCDFSGTEFDKDNECSECGEPTDDGQGYDGLCGNCADKHEPTA